MVLHRPVETAPVSGKFETDRVPWWSKLPQTCFRARWDSLQVAYLPQPRVPKLFPTFQRGAVSLLADMSRATHRESRQMCPFRQVGTCPCGFLDSLRTLDVDLQAHQGGIVFTLLGVGGLLYALLAKSISFQGDFPLAKNERKPHAATPAVRIRAAWISLLPLGYGIYLWFWG
jgi:hypothetical protein